MFESGCAIAAQRRTIFENVGLVQLPVSEWSRIGCNRLDSGKGSRMAAGASGAIGFEVQENASRG